MNLKFQIQIKRYESEIDSNPLKNLKSESEIKVEPEVSENVESKEAFLYKQQDGDNDYLEVKDEDIFKMQWQSFSCKPKQLRLDIVLKCGQSFRWTTPFRDRPNEYVGVLGSKVWILKQESDKILYKTLQKEGDTLKNNSMFKKVSTKQRYEEEEYLRDYFQLNVDLEFLYNSWAKVDPVFSDISKSFVGVRMLRQDPVENIFSFICSSNNNIQRISGMIEKMC